MGSSQGILWSSAGDILKDHPTPPPLLQETQWPEILISILPFAFRALIPIEIIALGKEVLVLLSHQDPDIGNITPSSLESS